MGIKEMMFTTELNGFIPVSIKHTFIVIAKLNVGDDGIRSMKGGFNGI